MILPDRPFKPFTMRLSLCLICLLFVSCAPEDRSIPLPGGDTEVADGLLFEPRWQELLQVTPVAYGSPVPPADITPVDGLYVKLDPSVPQAWLCRRCADYRSAGGIWRLQLDRGVMRIYYEVTGWRSLGSYVVDGDQFVLYNDPYCPEVIGHYAWEVNEDELSLLLMGDDCSFGLRGLNLSQMTWQRCTGGAAQPIGCEKTKVDEQTIPVLPSDWSVDVFEGDSRFFDLPPEVTVYANDHRDIPGFSVRADERTIAYGLNRILWWGGNWIESSPTDELRAYGVQFLGDPQIGWARVLLDGIEVWRGNTSQIWSDKGRHGGYVQVLLETPGVHTIRVESLDVDYRPVTIASFGFGYGEGVEAAAPEP